jgi:hypothetical protein
MLSVIMVSEIMLTFAIQGAIMLIVFKIFYAEFHK